MTQARNTKSHRLTQAFVKNLPIPAEGRTTLNDDRIKGLGIRLSRGGSSREMPVSRPLGIANMGSMCNSYPGQRPDEPKITPSNVFNQKENPNEIQF